MPILQGPHWATAEPCLLSHGHVHQVQLELQRMRSTRNLRDEKPYDRTTRSDICRRLLHIRLCHEAANFGGSQPGTKAGVGLGLFYLSAHCRSAAAYLGVMGSRQVDTVRRRLGKRIQGMTPASFSF